MKKTILIFGSLAVIMILLFQLEKWSLFALGGSQNIYPIVSGFLFLILGILVSRNFYIKTEERKKAKHQSLLSNQEHQVLILVAKGLSNKEIAQQLFISEATVKTHVSKIFSKLNAKRRTEAVRIGQELEII